MVWHSALLHRGLLDGAKQHAFSVAVSRIETRLGPEHCSGRTHLRSAQRGKTPQRRRTQHGAASQYGQRSYDTRNKIYRKECERWTTVLRIRLFLTRSRADA